MGKLDKPRQQIRFGVNGRLPQVVIRHAVEDDLRAIEWGEAYREYRSVYAEVYQRMGKGLALMWVAEQPDWGLIGQAFVQFKTNDRKTADGRRRAYVHSFRVKPAWQGRGLGSRLMEVVEEDLAGRGFREVTLNVAKDNLGALRLYRRLGYEVVSEIPGRWSYYDPEGVLKHVCEPGFRMIKRLRG
jgi:ribosomal protein S18 acetylase RimI-like enzyme